MSRWIDNSAMKFGLVGAANTVSSLAVIYAEKWFWGFDDVTANMTGYAAGMVQSFVLNKRWTFGHSGDTVRVFFYFATVLLIAYLLNLVSVIGALSLGIHSYVAQALGVIPYTVFSYLVNKHLVFVARRGDPKPKTPMKGG